MMTSSHKMCQTKFKGNTNTASNRSLYLSERLSKSGTYRHVPKKIYISEFNRLHSSRRLLWVTVTSQVLMIFPESPLHPSTLSTISQNTGGCLCVLQKSFTSKLAYIKQEITNSTDLYFCGVYNIQQNHLENVLNLKRYHDTKDVLFIVLPKIV